MRLRLVSTAVAFSLLCLTSCSKSDKDASSSRNKLSYSDTAVYQWCDAYLDYNFDACDNKTSSQSNKLSGYYASDQFFSTELSIPLYQAVLRKSADSIVAIESVPTDTDTEVSDSDIQYCLRVTYKPFAKTSINLDVKGYRSICDDYLSGGLNKQEFDSKVEDWIVQSLEENLQYSEAESSFSFMMLETEENGRFVVKNSSEFCKTLMKKQGMIPIIKNFEVKFKEEFERVTETYLSA